MKMANAGVENGWVSARWSQRQVVLALRRAVVARTAPVYVILTFMPFDDSQTKERMRSSEGGKVNEETFALNPLALG